MSDEKKIETVRAKCPKCGEVRMVAADRQMPNCSDCLINRVEIVQFKLAGVKK